MDLGKRLRSKEPLIVAELGVAHMGSPQQALDHVLRAHAAGAAAIKLQHHSHDEFANFDHPWRHNLLAWELPHQVHAELRHTAHMLGMYYGSTPFSLGAWKALHQLAPDFVKIGGGSHGHAKLVARIMREHYGPVFVSDGCGDASHVIHESEKPDVLHLHCVSRYPTAAGDADLQAVTCRDGLSDHSGKPWAGLAAVALGARVIEVHFPQEGPDAESSLNDEGLAALCNGAHWIWQALQGQGAGHDPEVLALAVYARGRRGR